MRLTGDALINRAYALAMEYGGYDNYDGFRTLDAEWDFIAAALPHLLIGDNDRLQAVCDQMMFFLNFSGRWDERLWLCKQGEERALTAADYHNAGRRVYGAGYVYGLRNQASDVLACASRSKEYLRHSSDINKALVIQLFGIGHTLNKDYPAAIAAHREALEIYRYISPESVEVAIVLANLADVEHKNEDDLNAERDFREALRIAKEIKNDELISGITGNLAELALDQEQWGKAEFLAREALTLAERVGRVEVIAGCCKPLAKAVLKQNKNLEEASSLAHRAIEIFSHLRMSKELQDAQETLTEIEKAMRGE